MFDLIKILLPARSIENYKLKEEQTICVDIANYLRVETIENKFPFVWFHIPNEFSNYNAAFGLKQGWMGRIPGAPDFCFVGEKSFFIEIKTKKTKQTPSQVIFEEWCLNLNVPYFVCRSTQEAVDIIESKKNENSISPGGDSSPIAG